MTTRVRELVQRAPVRTGRSARPLPHLHRWWLALAVAVLAACSQLPRLPQTPASRDSVLVSGRIAVRVEGQAERSFSAGFELEGTPEAGRLTLSTPLGTQLARAQWQPGRAWLSNTEGVHEFSDVETLAELAIGERVPLPAMFDWLAGRPWRDVPSRALPTPDLGFEQLGWTVRLEGLANGLLSVHRSAPHPVTVRARLDGPPAPAGAR